MRIMQVNDIFKCEKCGKILEVIRPAGPGPACCGGPMTLLKENSVDAAREKHVPVIEKIDGGSKVKVGSVPHPMTPEHWIVAIELIAGNQILRQTLNPDDQPEAVFMTKATNVKTREYCNQHGLWVAEA
jgi:superoxide reductase